MFGAPGYSKDVVDVINACDRRYLMRKIYIIGTLNLDDSESRMNTYSIVYFTS